MNYKIVSDSSSDIFAMEGVPYASVPLKIITDEKEYVDNTELSVDEMIADLRKYKGTSKSSCPNMEDWNGAFDSSLDGAFCVTITRNLSGSYNSACLAGEDFCEENPGKRIFVVDTLTAGPECALIVERLAQLISSGLEFDEIREAICEYKKETHLLFCLESLRNLANNGRVSHAVAKMAGILGIRVVGKASEEGTLEIESKVRGAEKAINEMYSRMKIYGYRGGRVRIHQCQNPEGAESLCRLIRDEYPEAAVIIEKTGALCSFYAEAGGFLVGFEGAKR
ncbi:MAG: DegV family protein [Clostridia bacterium]|nr:DegV family protein [Clostridia bacterium]